MISERTLRTWRKEALDGNDDDIRSIYKNTAQVLVSDYIEYRKRVLKMTQELLDQHLMRR